MTRLATGWSAGPLGRFRRRPGPDDGAEYDDRVEIDLDSLGPLVAKPHNPDNVVPVEEVAGTEIAQVCIGSSVNSGYNDLALPGAVLADRDGQIVHPSIAATATPGSRQILAAIAESGVYRQLSDGGVRMLEPVCGPCVGMGQAPPSDSNSLRTFNRNFPGRSGTPGGLGVPVLAGGGGGVAADRQDRGPARIRGRARAAADARAAAVRRGRPHLRAGRRFGGGAIEIPRGPNIKRPPEHKPLGDSLEARIATVQPDDISTGDLAPDGVEVMAYRSNVPAIAEFTLRHRDPEFRKRLKEWGSGFIVAGDNYGQGSSREHAALAPLHLGVKAVIAKSFARIHRRNLIAQGIVALTFSDAADYDKAEVGQCWSLPALREELESGAETIGGRIEDSGRGADAEPRLLRARARDLGRRRSVVVFARRSRSAPANGAIDFSGNSCLKTRTHHSARRDQEGLDRPADPAALVVEDALGDPDAVARDPGLRLETDPLPDGSRSSKASDRG